MITRLLFKEDRIHTFPQVDRQVWDSFPIHLETSHSMENPRPSAVGDYLSDRGWLVEVPDVGDSLQFIRFLGSKQAAGWGGGNKKSEVLMISSSSGRRLRCPTWFIINRGIRRGSGA